MPGEGYLRWRQIFGNNSGSQAVLATDAGPFTLVTVKTNYTIYVQHITVRLTTGSAGKTWSIQDAAGKTITGNIPCDTAPAEFDIDFGAQGVALPTAGSNLVLSLSASGAAGQVTFDVFQKLSAVISASQAG